VIREAERWAAVTAKQIITLSKSDQEFVYDSGWIPQHQPCPFLPPGIRSDVAALPLPPDIPVPNCAGHGGHQIDANVAQSSVTQVKSITSSVTQYVFALEQLRLFHNP
jgi:hypothetical protein